MTLKDIIKALGGGSTVAAGIGCGPSAVSNWLSDGAIPKGRWPDLLQLAERNGVSLTLADIRAAHSKEAA